MPIATSNGIPLFYEDTGTGPAVVLGHSFLCDGSMWREQVPTLATQYRVLNADLRGHGQSGPLDEPFSPYDLVADVVAVLDHAGVEQAVWCGLSIGGMTAMRAALTRPDRVTALILIDTDAGAERSLKKLKYRAMGLGARLMGVAPFLPAISRLMFGTTTRRQNAALVREWHETASQLHVPSILHVLDALMRRDSVLDRLHEVAVPALVIVGDEDTSLPPRVSRRIHERLPDSRCVTIPRAGHLTALEQPVAVSAAIAEFLTEIHTAS